jgi:undecaprenyl diphosphate synthase
MKKEDFTHLPSHVAIIMDGNGRWAKKIGRKRAFGHENGASSVRECIDQSMKLGIKNLTLFVFFYRELE